MQSPAKLLAQWKARFPFGKKRAGWMVSGFVENLVCMVHVTQPDVEKSDSDSSGSGNSGASKPMISAYVLDEVKDNNHNALSAIARKFTMKDYRCIFLLGYREYQLIQVEKPNVPAEEVKQAIRWKIRDQLSYPAEQAELQVLDIPVDAEKPEQQANSLVAVAQNALIRDYMVRFNEFSKNSLEVIDLPELAQRNIARLLEQNDRGLALLTMNSKGGLLTFTAKGELYQARYFAADTASITEKGSQAQQELFEKLSLELQRLLDNFELKFPHITLDRLVLAPFIGRDNFSEYLNNYLNIKVETFAVSTIFDMEPHIKLGDLSDQGNALLFLGAALREEVSA